MIADVEVRINESQRALLRERAEIIEPPEWDEETLVAAAEGVDYILHSFFPTISARLIEASDNLKATVKYGVGTDNVDIPAATARGVKVINCPEYGSNTVADHAFALLMALARRIIDIDRATKETAWVWPSTEFIGVDLSGKTLGLIGCGRIGRAMAKRAGGFDMEQIYYDPYVPQSEVAGYGVRAVGLEELLERSDFISIHCVLTPETRGMVDAAAFRRMKKGAYLIDVSRGAILEEEALIAALNEERLAGAGIDVYPVEPMPPGYALLAARNVILTSHLAWYTVEADARLAQECMDRTLELLDGRQPRNIVNGKALALS
jgi:D-3-phosphoglycerate dehydrogenase / 2-oxoglutarate reductase